MLSVLKKPVLPWYTVFVPFTRDWFLDQWLESFSKIRLPYRQTELVFYVDTPGDIGQNLAEYFKHTSFNGLTIYETTNPKPIQSRVNSRRDRIVEQKEVSKGLIHADSELVFCLEDDTTVEPDAFERLYFDLQDFPYTGYVSGVQVGRWGIPYIGAWQMDDIDNPTSIHTLSYAKEGVAAIEGGGFYCYLTPSNLYRQATYRWHDECFGPDVCYVHDLVKEGYRALVDASVVATHHVGTDKALVPNENCVSIEYIKTENGWELQPVPAFKQS